MTRERKLGKSLFFSALTSGSNLFLFGLSILAARYLGDAAYGRFSYALDFVTIFTYLAGASMCMMGTVKVARDRTQVNRFFGNLLTLQALLAVVTVGIIFVLIRRFQASPEAAETRLAVYILCAAMVGRAFKSSFRQLFKTFERFDLESLSMALGQGALFAVGWWMLGFHYGLIPFVIAFATVRVLDVMLTFLLIRRSVAPLAPRFDLEFWPTLVRGGLLFAAIMVLDDVSFRIDTVFLGSFKVPYAAIGWYKAAYKIPEGLAEIHAIVSLTLLPSLSVAFTQSRQEVVGLYRCGVKLLLLAGLPLVAFVSLEAEPLMRLVFGAQFLPAAGVLRVLVFVVPLLFMTGISSVVLMGVDRVGVTFWRSMLAAGINVLLNVILIPRLGIMGAAIATVVTELVAATLVTSYLFNHGYGFAWSGLVGRLALATLALTAVTALLRPLPLLLVMPLAAATYVGALVLLRLWGEQERQMFMGAVGVLGRRETAASQA
jgi:O-antigen/teichoic acid export membrane protein